MAFDANFLGRNGPQNSNAPVQWTYFTADTLATVDTSGYFNSAADRLQVADMIYAYTSTGPAAGIAYVQSNTRDLLANPPVQGVVDTTNFTAVGTVDSD
jgi:hypothetical protein